VAEEQGVAVAKPEELVVVEGPEVEGLPVALIEVALDSVDAVLGNNICIRCSQTDSLLRPVMLVAPTVLYVRTAQYHHVLDFTAVLSCVAQLSCCGMVLDILHCVVCSRPGCNRQLDIIMARDTDELETPPPAPSQILPVTIFVQLLPDLSFR